MLGVIYLAMEKDDLIKEIKQREEELDREKLLRQIQLKENELQRLLSGIDQKEFLVPGNGIWKIQSQKLDGKSIPKAEWIVPQMSPDFRYTNASDSQFAYGWGGGGGTKIQSFLSLYF